MKFAIFTHVEHIKMANQYYAYAPYVREMNLWLKHVEEVEVVGTRRRVDLETRELHDKEEMRRRGKDIGGGGEQGIVYNHSDLTFTEVPSFNFLNFLSTVKAVIKIPYILYKIMGAMKRTDHVHLRCPGNIGLLACICQIFFPGKPKSAKYAGNWDPSAKQPWTYRFQKWVLSNTFLTRNMKVLVYGEWPGQSENILPFFTATFLEVEKTEVRKKTFSEPLSFLFVGNLVKGKRPLAAIKLVEELNIVLKTDINKEPRILLEVYGDGPERKKLENYVRENQLDHFVAFKGNRLLEELKEAYQRAHFVILLSQSEGWPKAIAEGMFFGCISIATAVSCVPWMLGSPTAPERGAKNYYYAKRGILIDAENFRNGGRVERKEENKPRAMNQDGKKECTVVSDQWSEDLTKINELLADPERIKKMSDAAKNWSQQYTLERFESAIKEIMNKSKQISSSPFGRGGGFG